MVKSGIELLKPYRSIKIITQQENFPVKIIKKGGDSTSKCNKINKIKFCDKPRKYSLYLVLNGRKLHPFLCRVSYLKISRTKLYKFLLGKKAESVLL